MRIRFKSAYIDDFVDVKFFRYGTGSICIKLFDAETGEPIATLTTAVDEIRVPYDHVVVKDYSENTGVLNELINQGFGDHVMDVCGFPILRLNPVVYLEAERQIRDET